MKTYLLTCSVDGNMVDYEEIIKADSEPDFWTQYEIAEKHGCSFFNCIEI